MRTLKTMPRNLNVIVCSWIRLLDTWIWHVTVLYSRLCSYSRRQSTRYSSFMSTEIPCVLWNSWWVKKGYPTEVRCFFYMGKGFLFDPSCTQLKSTYRWLMNGTMRNSEPVFLRCWLGVDFKDLELERTRQKVRGTIVHKAGRKYQHDWLYLQSINSTKHQ